MVQKIIFWTGFGLAVRAWQLGIEQRPLFHKSYLWVYPFFGGIGGSFGYWLMGVEKEQQRDLNERRAKLLEKRERRAKGEDERDLAGATVDGQGGRGTQYMG